MKNITMLLLIVFLTLFTGCGGGGTSAEDTVEDTLSLPKTIVLTKTIAAKQQTVVEIEGKENDLLTITIPKLPFGQVEDMNVTFKLSYEENETLPTISIDKDIEFDTAVTLQFRSDNLSDDSYIFIYHGATQDYSVPFEKDGNVYTAKLLHFSDYGFNETPSYSTLITKIEAGLDQLGQYQGDDGIYGLDRSIIGDIVGNILTLDRVEPALEHTYMEQLLAIIEAAVDRWLLKMKNVSVAYWDGYCIHSEVKDFISKLVQTMTEMELIGAKSIDAEVNSLIDKHITDAYAEWKTLTPPAACDTSGVQKYVSCGVTFMTEAELAGVDISGEEQMQIIVDYVESNVLYVINNASCKDIACAKYYLAMAKNNELEYMGIGTDYTSQLQALVDRLEKSIENDNCSNLWRFHVSYTHPEWGSGTYTATDIEIDFDAQEEFGTKMFAIHDISTCGGDLSSCGSLLIYSGMIKPMVVQFEASIYTNAELGFQDVTSDEFVSGNNGFVCDGAIPDGFNATSGATSWYWSAGYQSCSYTLEPME